MEQLPQRPLDVVAQTTLLEQPEPAQGNPGLIASGSGTGTGTVAGPTTAGGIGERTHHQWTGTLMWRNGMKRAGTQVTAIARKGNPLASTWPKVLLLAATKQAVSTNELQDWIKKTNPVVMQIRPASASVANNHGYRLLVQSLRTGGCYAVSGWKIEGKDRPTANLLIAVLMQGLLLGAAFPTSGIPQIPKPRSPQLNPAAPQVSTRMDSWWTGTVMWQGIEKKEVRAQITATQVVVIDNGSPLASTWPETLSLAPAGPAVSLVDLREWIKKTNPALVQIHPALGANDHNYGQLVKLLKEKGYYAVSGWKIRWMGRSTMNLLIAPYVEDALLGAVFPTTGIPEIPKPRRLPQLDPAAHQAIMSVLPQQIRALPEPQLSQAIRQAYEHQQRSFKRVGVALPNH